MQDELIIENINKHNKDIVEKLVPHFRSYLFIKKEFSENNVGNDFKNSFCHFYKLNGPGGLNQFQKTKFFLLLSERENNLKRILLALYKVPGYQNHNKLYLSFASKLLHTLNNDLPIYDRNIASILDLPNQINGTSLKNRIKNRADIYAELKKRFHTLLKNKEIKAILKKNKKLLNLRGLISDVKLLDSILWALFQI